MWFVRKGIRASSEESFILRKKNGNISRASNETTDSKVNIKRMSFPNTNATDEEMGLLAPFMGCGSVPSNYSYLDTATKFGPVVKGFKKPGHHIPGPVRNPHCPCHHCRRYFENQKTVKEETDGRVRAFSLSHADRLSSKSTSKDSPDNYFNSSSYDSLNTLNMI
jgi:hypothetical protein